MTLATGVGSMPGDDDRAYAEAVRIVLGELPDLPHVPELPGRGAGATMTGRGLAVVSDTGALGAAVDQAIADNPDIAEKVRGGKVAAAGALVGAVMKATRGQADAAAVRELILQRLGAS